LKCVSQYIISILRHPPVLGGMLLMCIFITMPLTAQRVAEYQVKAAFLYNFTKFLDWPAHSFGNADDPFVVGILGNDPFGSFLDETIAGEKIAGHNMIVQRYKSVQDIKKCHILFINLPGKNGEVTATLRGRGILTVSDDENFMRQGGIIRFYSEGNTIKLEINQKMARAEKLNISSKLLRIARIHE
jgi:YfiR/HmsC-like